VPVPEAYFAYAFTAPDNTYFPVIIRVKSDDPTAVTATVRVAIREIDTEAAVSEIRPMTDVIARSMGTPRFYLTLLGLFAAVAGAVCRAGMLLITRARLADADARLVTWYTLWSSMVVFAALSATSRTWHWPHGEAGWVAFVGIGFTTTVAILALYVSTQRVGPSRTALYMNLEPLMTAVLSSIVLGDRMTPLQLIGGTVMIAALCIFQLRY